MALTRKMLEGLNIEPDQIDQIIDAHAQSIAALKEERNKALESAKEVDALKAQIEELKASSEDAEEWRIKFAETEKAFKDFKADTESKATLANKQKLYAELLKDAGIDPKRIDSVTRVANLDKIEIEDGKIKNAEQLAADVKDEWADFIQHVEEQGAAPETPPAGIKNSMTKDEIMAIKDPIDRQKAMAENWNLFAN